jgi:hypothetical protein
MRVSYGGIATVSDSTSITRLQSLRSRKITAVSEERKLDA